MQVPELDGCARTLSLYRLASRRLRGILGYSKTSTGGGVGCRLSVLSLLRVYLRGRTLLPLA